MFWERIFQNKVGNKTTVSNQTRIRLRPDMRHRDYAGQAGGQAPTRRKIRRGLRRLHREVLVSFVFSVKVFLVA